MEEKEEIECCLCEKCGSLVVICVEKFFRETITFLDAELESFDMTQYDDGYEYMCYVCGSFDVIFAKIKCSEKEKNELVKNVKKLVYNKGRGDEIIKMSKKILLKKLINGEIECDSDEDMEKIRKIVSEL